MQLPDLNIRTAIKIRSTDPEVTMVIRSRVSVDGSVCEIYHVDGSYSAMMGTKGESRLLSVLVNPGEQEAPIPFTVATTYDDHVASHYYRSDGQWFEILID